MYKIELSLVVLISILLLSCNNKKEPDPGVITDNTVTDVCGNTYKIITIGTQTWMAENMRCDTYDTQSENAGEKIVTVAEAISSNTSRYLYVKADDKSLWDESACDEDLSDEQIAKLGYLYSRTSALGIRYYEGEVLIDPYTGNEFHNYNPEKIDPQTPRQGICPNGWRLPNDQDWFTLNNLNNPNPDKYNNGAGRLLKSVSGWCSSSEDYKAGIDQYSFNALPSGCYVEYVEENGKILGVGKESYWISVNEGTALPIPPYDFMLYECEYMSYNHDDPNIWVSNNAYPVMISNSNYVSVRCIKNGSVSISVSE